MLRFLTSGESHGKALLGILEGMPAGLKIDRNSIDEELSRRQSGYGRGERMQIEKDKVDILSGVIKSVTIGSPIGLLIKNKDASIDKLPPLYFPRPGHGDLAGGLKYGFGDLRCVLERASARETAVRVAVGAICKTLLDKFKIKISSEICSIGGKTQENKIKQVIDEAKKNKDTLGGIFKIVAKGVPVGLGSYVHYDRRLDAGLACGLMSVPAIKAVEIGLGFGYADKHGSDVHDAIYYNKNKGYYRLTNNAGGIEAGVSNGENIVLRVCMKPISTLGNSLDSVDIRNKKPHKAQVERYDTCAVYAASVVGEAVVAFEIAKAFLEKFGSDSIKEISRNFISYLKSI
ncbi:MAG: chorismate synthase [Candidatus Omnitrophica bacterium]|nr:chorismate synthase [Candidatus Omnitrophota bacterium]MDD5351825.1 chorismate synthase [Candidatus Omnitrophota bacterium]MDD5550651.1 chorismate synthase [Candidatus Omnitrophota bacterium]